MMDAATRGITKAGTSENTMRVRVDDDFLHQELLDLNETIRDHHRLAMYFPNRTRLIYGSGMESVWEWGSTLWFLEFSPICGGFPHPWMKHMPKPV